jgi:hypothetical protein
VIILFSRGCPRGFLRQPFFAYIYKVLHSCRRLPSADLPLPEARHYINLQNRLIGKRMDKELDQQGGKVKQKKGSVDEVNKEKWEKNNFN